MYGNQASLSSSLLTIANRGRLVDRQRLWKIKINLLILFTSLTFECRCSTGRFCDQIVPLLVIVFNRWSICSLSSLVLNSLIFYSFLLPCVSLYSSTLCDIKGGFAETERQLLSELIHLLQTYDYIKISCLTSMYILSAVTSIQEHV